MTEQYRKEYLQLVKETSNSEDHLIEFLMNPFYDASPAHFVKVCIGNTILPDVESWAKFGEPVQFPWIIPTLFKEEVLESIRLKYWRDKQCKDSGKIVRDKLVEVLREMKFRAYTLTPRRIITRVVGEITDLSIDFASHYKYSSFTRADYVSIVSLLVQYELVPKIFREAIFKISQACYDECLENPAVLEPVFVVNDKSSINILEEMKLIAPDTASMSEVFVVPVQGTYDAVLSEQIIETSVLHDGRPVIVGMFTYEIPSMGNLPGANVYGIGSNVVDDMLKQLTISKLEFRWVYALGIGDKENQNIIVTSTVVEADFMGSYDPLDILKVNGFKYNSMSKVDQNRVNPRIRTFKQLPSLLRKYASRYRDRSAIKDLCSIYKLYGIVPEYFKTRWSEMLTHAVDCEWVYERFLIGEFQHIASLDDEMYTVSARAYAEMGLTCSYMKDWPRILDKWVCPSNKDG